MLRPYIVKQSCKKMFYGKRIWVATTPLPYFMFLTAHPTSGEGGMYPVLVSQWAQRTNLRLPKMI